jgi:signal transduction histidine kinase
VRRRIVTLAIAAAILAISLFGLPLAVGVARYYLDDERAELERVADAAALSVADELAHGLQAPQLPAASANTALALYSPDGARRTGDGPPAADPTATAAVSGRIATGNTGDDLVVAVPIIDENRLAGVVRAATPHTEVYRRIGLTWLGMLGLAVLAVGATWLIARRMAARLATPLEDLSGVAQQLGQGDFTVRTRRAGIPEIDSVGAALDTTARHLGGTLDRERAFSADASHQLRTPLTGLRLQLEGALDAPEPEARDALRGGIDAADRLENIIDDLLALARDTATTTEAADLDALLAEVDDGFRRLLTAADRTLLVEDHGAPRPLASPAAIRQILTVLVDNAVTHGAGTVSVIARDAGDVVAIDVSDEGPGVQPGRELFARRQDSARGHGIGLALARSLAEAEGGRLLLGKPSPPTFTLLLRTVPH